MKVAVLGCGPAGLLAAHAAASMDHEVTIYSMKWKSKMFGAMYLHRAIPDITPHHSELEIVVIKSGVREGYATNVYGDPDAPCSWDHFTDGVVYGWDLTKAYDLLWEKYEPLIVNRTIDRRSLDFYADEHDVVFSSIPASHICLNEEHVFDAQKIWVVHGDGSERLIPGVNDNNIMYYNGYTQDLRYGMAGPAWYRFSQINRYQAWEYSTIPPITGAELEVLKQKASTGVKPLKTNCDCYPLIRRIGRFGKWQKGVLTHHAYEEAHDALQQL